MFPARYYPGRMYAGRFWPKVGGASTPFVGPTRFASTSTQRGVGVLTATSERRGTVSLASTGTLRGVGVDRSEGQPR